MLVKYYLYIIGVLTLLIIFLTFWIIQFNVDTPGTDPLEGQVLPSLPKVTVADFQGKRMEFKEKYPALPFWQDVSNAPDGYYVELLNMAIEAAAEDLNKEGGNPKSKEQLLAHANALMEKANNIDWPVYIQEKQELLQSIDELLEGKEDRKLATDQFIEQLKADHASVLKVLERLDKLGGEIQGLDNMAQEMREAIEEWETSQSQSDDAEETREYPQGSIVKEEPVDAVTPEELRFLSRPPPLSALVKPDMTASALPWHDLLTSALRKWEKDFFDSYPNALSVTFFSAEEFAEVFPTERDRQFLRDEQNRMLIDITQRVEELLSSDTSASWEEKLSITENVLSQYWGTSFAESIINRLQ